MNDSKGLISSMTRKWKLEQIPSKKLEIENKLMEERLTQLKTQFNFEKNKRNAMGGTIWSKAQPGPVTNYGKNVVNRNESGDNLLNKLTNRQIKLQVLKDDYLQKQHEKLSSVNSKEKKLKCGQCEKNLAFTRCLECGEDYCANCFTSFHMKGALQKHRTVSISSVMNKQASRPQSTESRNEDNESIYDITSNRSNSAKKKVEFTLLEGQYDEQEAQESFQQALQEWRNSSKKSNESNQPQLTSRDAGVETSQPKTSQIQELEKKITSHSLSHAERMLLQKYRRNDLEVIYTPRSVNESTDQTSVNESIETRQSHLNFDSIIQALQGGRTNSFINDNENDFDLVNYIKAPIDLEPVNNLNFDELHNNHNENTVKFEEIESLSKIKSINLNLKLEPEIIEVKSSIKEIDRPKSVKSSTRVKSARPKSELQKFEENLTRETTNLLKSIANREAPATSLASQKMGDFFMLNVAQMKENTPRPASSVQPVQSSRIDPKLYAMSPRSWNPQKSVAKNLAASVEVKKKSVESSINKSHESPVENSTEMFSKKKLTNKAPISVSSSINFENKKLPTKTIKKIEYDRAKSFALPKKSPMPKNKRPISASHNLDRPVSRANYEFADRFAEFDIDDGRSSRICQNDDDNKYFGQLLNEYNSSIMSHISDINDMKVYQSNTQDLYDSLNRSFSNLEMTIRNDENDDDDLESLTMEELRSLK